MISHERIEQIRARWKHLEKGEICDLLAAIDEREEVLTGLLRAIDGDDADAEYDLHLVKAMGASRDLLRGGKFEVK